MASSSAKPYCCSSLNPASSTPLARGATLSTLPATKHCHFSHGLSAVAANPRVSHSAVFRPFRACLAATRRPEYVPHRIDDPNYVRIFDTTLRDGEQSPGATMTSGEKLVVARQLARLGVDIIEAGFPASSPDDLDAVRSIAIEVGNTPVGEDGHVPVICGLSRCNKKDIDAAWEAVRHAQKPRIHTFIATSEIHMQHKLRKTPEQVVAIAREMVAYARSLGCLDVEFSPEDAGRSNREFLYRILEEVIKAGATTLNIPDTVGYTLPHEFGKLIADIKANTPGIENAIISTHCQNDLGLASANTLAGAYAGARQLEVTINGIGERAGNASLEEVVMAIKCRRELLGGLYTGINSQHITMTSKMVQEHSGLHVQPHKAIVGANAFAHESGTGTHSLTNQRFPGLKPLQIRRAKVKSIPPAAPRPPRRAQGIRDPSAAISSIRPRRGQMGEEGAINGGEEGPGLAAAPHDRWVLLRPAQGSPRPSARYKHAAEVVQDKLYVVGGSRNGRSLSDLQVFDFRTSKWSALSPSRDSNLENNAGNQPFPALAGHSMVKWRNMLLVVAGNTRASSSNKVSVWLIDVETNSWSAVDTYGKIPMARGGQSVTLVGSRLIMFGGEDNKRRLLSDLHVLDLETMIWEELKTEKGGPAPRYDHSAAVYADHYLLIFGGSSHSTCFNDLYLLDLQTLEWSQPDTQGAHITPRSGHAGMMIDENWYIVGGGDNASGATDTIVMNASKFVWSVVTSVSVRDPLACEGLTLSSTTIDGEKFLIAFGGYNGKYNNEVFVMKPKPRNFVQPRLLQSPAAAAAAASVKAAYAVITASDEKTKDIVATDDLDVKRAEPGSSSKQMVAEIDALNGEKGELESRLAEVRSENSKLKDKLDMVKLSYGELTKELRSVENQLAAEGSRCQKLESQIAAAHKRLESASSLENELEALQQQISQAEQTVTTSQRRKSGGVWKWVAGSAEVSDNE